MSFSREKLVLGISGAVIVGMLAFNPGCKQSENPIAPQTVKIESHKFLRPEEIVGKYMLDYIDNYNGYKTDLERWNKTWSIIQTDLAQVTIADEKKEGVYIRDFPDQKISEVQKAGLNYGEKAGIFSQFIAIYDKNDNHESIWGFYWDKDKSFLKTFAVYYKGQWLATFETEGGKYISGEDLFKSYIKLYPPNYPKPEKPLNVIST